MSLSWFRFYNSVLDDPKVQLLSDALYRAWTNLLCLASKLEGVIPDDMSVVSFALRKSPAKAKEMLEALIRAGLIERHGDGYQPHNWSARQFARSDDSAPRVRAHRKRYSNGGETVTVTPPDSDTDSDTETETALPPWLPLEPWEAFVEMRRKIRAPLTDRAKALAIGELEKLRGAGEDPGTVLNQSVQRAWRGLFPTATKPAANAKVLSILGEGDGDR